MRRILPGLVAAWLLLLLAHSASAQVSIALFDADANLSNVAKLKSVMGTFLRSVDADAKFQPFTKSRDVTQYMQIYFVTCGQTRGGQLPAMATHRTIDWLMIHSDAGKE